MLLSIQIFSCVSTLSISTPPSSSSSSRCRLRIRCSSPNSIAAQVQKSQSIPIPIIAPSNGDGDGDADSEKMNEKEKEKEKEKENEEEEEGGSKIPGIQVPRQTHIPVSKSELIDAIVSNLLISPQEIHQFLRLSSCLDSILHAEHKSILEEIRVYFDLTDSMGCKGSNGENSSRSKRKSMPNDKKHDSVLGNFTNNGSLETSGEVKINSEKSMPSDLTLDSSVCSSLKNVQSKSLKESSKAAATRFQHVLMQLLYNAEFEELSARDLMLTSALNTDYLLTLPIYVDWKKAFDSNAIIFRRGYATERQKGLLIVEKLDYLQSKLVQRIFFSVAKPLGKAGIRLIEALKTSRKSNVQVWARMQLWLNELPFFRQLISSHEDLRDKMMGADPTSHNDLPIWLAAQRAVARYEGTLSAVGPRGRLLRKLLSWVGLLPSSPKQKLELDSLDSDSISSELYLRPIFLPRISLSDIWTPASPSYCRNDFWKMLKTAISILFSQSVLQEPAFQELFLLYTKEMDEIDSDHKVEVPPMQLKIYEKIPIPDLPVIFPHKKLSFRILDTVRLDIASILGLLAFFINYKFEDILSSPSAVLLDVIAISALVIYVTRVVLGYKQTRDRYQLLVNRTLYEKTVASGFGSVHFLIDASEQQQYKEAILAYAILLKADNGQMSCTRNVGEKCEKFIYTVFGEKVKMPIEKAKNTLVRLGIVTENAADGKTVLQAIPCSKASEILEERWTSLLG